MAIGILLLGVRAGILSAPTPLEVLELSNAVLEQVVERAKQGAYTIEGRDGHRVRCEMEGSE